MNQYNKDTYYDLKTQEDIDQFLDKMLNMHDALIKEVVIIHRGYVDENNCMWGDAGEIDVRVIIQSQFSEVSSCELICKDVKQVNIQSDTAFEPHAVVDDDGLISIYFKEYMSSVPFMIKNAKSVKVRFLGRDCIGPGPFTVDPIELDEDERYGHE